jgi:hypothetical protein
MLSSLDRSTLPLLSCHWEREREQVGRRGDRESATKNSPSSVHPALSVFEVVRVVAPENNTHAELGWTVRLFVRRGRPRDTGPPPGGSQAAPSRRCTPAVICTRQGGRAAVGNDEGNEPQHPLRAPEPGRPGAHEPLLQAPRQQEPPHG